MAAKLTPEQKARNKTAVKLRNQAFTARKNTYLAELNAAKRVSRDSALARAANTASAAVDALLAGRDARVQDIQGRIAALQAELAAAVQEYEARLELLSDARRKAWDLWQKADHKILGDVAERYPDVATCWSAAVWKPLSDFLPLVKTP